MSFDIRTTTHIEDAAEFLCTSILNQLKSGAHVLWLVPGGSAILVATRTVKLLKEQKNESLFGNLTVTLTDERYGEVGHDNSNWEQLLDKGFDLSSAKLLPVLNGSNKEETIENFNRILSEELSSAQYKIGLFGIGADGHTAGILPESGAVSSENFAFGYQSPTFYRITMTPKAILHLDEAIVWAQGSDKWSVLENLQKDIPITKQPSRVLKKVPLLTIFTDYKKA